MAADVDDPSHGLDHGHEKLCCPQPRAGQRVCEQARAAYRLKWATGNIGCGDLSLDRPQQQGHIIGHWITRICRKHLAQQKWCRDLGKRLSRPSRSSARQGVAADDRLAGQFAGQNCGGRICRPPGACADRMQAGATRAGATPPCSRSKIGAWRGVYMIAITAFFPS